MRQDEDLWLFRVTILPKLNSNPVPIIKRLQHFHGSTPCILQKAFQQCTKNISANSA